MSSTDRFAVGSDTAVNQDGSDGARSGAAARTSADVSISLKDVGVIYKRGRKSDEVEALRKTNLDIGSREFVSLLGPSGCGKTTLLKAVGGLLEPTSGEVTINGGSVAAALKNRAFGMVFQNATLLPWRKVLANAEFLAEIVGDEEARRNRVPELLERVGLAGFDDHYPHELSGGMQQRVGIVRALSLDPDILLMDEPFAAVDALTRDQLGEMLLDIWGGGRPVVFVTHSIEESVFLSDRVVVMSARPGRVLQEVPIELPRPRDREMRDSAEFAAVRRELREIVDRAQAGA